MLKKRDKTVLIVLLCVTIGVLVAAMIVGIAWNNSGWMTATGPERSYETRQEFAQPMSDVQSIVVDAAMESIQIEAGTGNDIVVKQEATKSFKDADLATIRLESSSLHVRSGFKHGIHLFGTPGNSRIVVSIPASYDGDITLGTEAGDIALSNIGATSVEASTQAGSVYVMDLNCISFTNSTSAGDLESIGLACNELSCDTDLGNIDVSGQVKENAKLSTHAGDITFSGIAEDVTVSTDMGTIQMSFDQVSSIDADTHAGDITARVLNSSTLQSIQCETDTGNIEAQLPTGTSIALKYDTDVGSLDTTGANGIKMSSDGIPVTLETHAGSIILATVE